MSFIRAFLRVLCLGLAVAAVVPVSTVQAQERSFTTHVSILATVYAQEHGGQAPASWADLHPDMGDFDNPQEPLIPRYAFLETPVPLGHPYGAGSAIHLMSRRSFREVWVNCKRPGPRTYLSEPGRYVIVNSGDGSYYYPLWVRETEIQALFRGRESLLPTPDTEPKRAREVKAERDILIHRCVVGGLILLGLSFLPRILRRLPAAWARAARAAQESPACL